MNRKNVYLPAFYRGALDVGLQHSRCKKHSLAQLKQCLFIINAAHVLLKFFCLGNNCGKYAILLFMLVEI